ncbi:MAG: CHAT domain-containing protein [Phaeodactylibacter sp.]|nr:CHAT domain-containing protein [Phaeodactylibacter sp.]
MTSSQHARRLALPAIAILLFASLVFACLQPPSSSLSASGNPPASDTLPCVLSMTDRAAAGPQESPALHPDSIALASALEEEAARLFAALDFQGAIDRFRKVCRIWENAADTGEKNRRLGNTVRRIGVCQWNLGRAKAALDSYRSAQEYLARCDTVDYVAYIQLLSNFGIIFRDLGMFDSSEVAYKKAIEVGERCLPAGHPKLGVACYNYGVFLWNLGRYEASETNILRARDIFLQSSGKEKENWVYCDEMLGNIALHRGDLEKAMRHFREVLKGRLRFGPKVAAGITYTNIGNVYHYRGEQEKALEYFQKSLDIRKASHPENHPHVSESHFNIGAALLLLEDYEGAIGQFREAGRGWRATYGAFHYNMGLAHNNLGAAFLKTGDLERCKTHLDSALLIMQQSSGYLHPNTADVYLNLGGYFTEKKQYETAEEQYGQGLAALDFQAFKEGHPERLKKALIAVGLLRAKAELYEIWGETEKAFRTYGEVVTLIEQLSRSYAEEGSKLALINHSFPILEKLISLCLSGNAPAGAGAPELSFPYFERAKSLLLREAVQRSRALKFAGIPQQYLDRESQLRKEVIEWEKRRFEAASGPSGAGTADSLKQIEKRIFDYKFEWEALLKTIEKQYPDYYRLQYDNAVISMNGVQDSLLESGNEALLEYFVGDSAVFVFLVLKDTFHVKRITKDFPLEDWVAQMRRGIVRKFVPDTLFHPTDSLEPGLQYAQAAHRIYQKVFAPVDSLMKQDMKLLIIPDGALGYIPFDILLRRPAEGPDTWRTNDYLLGRYAIGYSHSATSLAGIKHRPTRKKTLKPFLGFAPSFDGSEAIASRRFIDLRYPGNRMKVLENNIPEVDTVQAIMGGDIYAGTLATKANFIRLAENYRIIHLATHGKANDQVGDYSFLAFYEPPADSLENGWLYNRELYNLPLNADMVVLSACETGIGELKRGEGIASLARGFSYAGARSIVTSLWSVDDEATGALMVYFYQHLKEGKEKHEALRLAKQDCLRGEDIEPFYWAGFIPIGDMEKMERPGLWNPLWVWMLNMGLVLTLLGLAVRLRVR